MKCTNCENKLTMLDLVDTYNLECPLCGSVQPTTRMCEYCGKQYCNVYIKGYKLSGLTGFCSSDCATNYVMCLVEE